MIDRPAIFITGAAAGIGRATAELYAAKGWFVGLYDLAGSACEGLRQKFGADFAIAESLDVTDAAAVEAALTRFWAKTGRLDVMFNNAGILHTGDFAEMPLARHHALVDVNLKGVINGAHAAFPYLKQTRRSALINMASASAINGTPAFATYGATKFAVKGLTEALSIEWARHGIRVMDLLPLFVATPMVNNVAAPPKSVGRLGINLQADDIAAMVWSASQWRLWPRTHWYPGVQTKLLAWTSKLLPAMFNRYSTKLVTGY
ncbi:MAG: SDR family oxidoreductase [Gammaproteobacteria bacterium]|jgi:NAD(P)-dependent dehydrogenase (short-subunit alcohol dehydrogenase family)|nr:SDR family oxidoreductase [Gammaproteobacteria bacterium]